MHVLTPIVGLGILGACAMAESRDTLVEGMERRSAGADCFSARSVSGFTPEGDEALVVRVGANRAYRLELAGYCPDIDWSQQIVLRSRAGSAWVCAGGDAEILVPSPTGAQNCLVSAVDRLTPAEIEARRGR